MNASSRASFGPDRRLHAPAEFSAVLSARRVIRGQRFDLLFRPATEAGASNPPVLTPRLGLIVPKRLAKASSLRNAVKRQAREAFRRRAGGLPAADIVLRLTAPLKGIRATDGEARRSWRVEIDGLFDRLPDRLAARPS